MESQNLEVKTTRLPGGGGGGIQHIYKGKDLHNILPSIIWADFLSFKLIKVIIMSDLDYFTQNTQPHPTPY